MRQREDAPLDPEVVATLDAIDAVLAGHAVDPGQAEMAELALLLRAERPQLGAGFAARLDERVERRFSPVPKAAGRKERRRWLWTPAAGLAAALVVAVVVVFSGGGARPHVVSGSAASSAGVMKAPVPALPKMPQHEAAPSGVATLDRAAGSQPIVDTNQSLAPFPNGRKTIQGAQLSLTTPAREVEQVAQEVFNAVGQARGIVMHSTVTATGGPTAYAEFQLSIPSASLAQTMAALSALPHARVASRTDTSQDVNDSYQADQRHLADARALRVSLLKQLASAVTQGEIDSLTARIHDAESAISSDESTLRSLQHQIAYSQVMLTINARALPVPVTHSSGFTLGRAAHDAGRVLTVAAGIVLIGLAALVPVALLVALVWWIGARLRQRRRLQALDVI